MDLNNTMIDFIPRDFFLDLALSKFNADSRRRIVNTITNFHEVYSND